MYFYYYYYDYYLYGSLPQRADCITFFGRISYILGDRKLYPWCERKLHVSKGVAETIKRNVIPGPGILLSIDAQECVNISWLLTGEGAPFRVTHAASESGFQKLFSRLVDAATEEGSDKKGQKYFLCHDNKQLLVAVSQPDVEYTYTTRKDKVDVKYTKWSMIHGPFGKHLYDDIVEQFSRTGSSGISEWFLSKTSHENMNSLISGYIGPVVYFGDGDKLEPSATLERITDVASDLSPLLKTVHQRAQSNKAALDNQLSPDLLASVVSHVDSYWSRQNITPEHAERWAAYCGIYTHCVRKKLAPNEISDSVLENFLEFML
ncbi:hypothetical protein [Endozoicomonas ascidiicola]|uniref:hypothetical protein n=1 Tax=Endozoicomonas ascidiicola TaxID=1698521 RepID=UPI00082D0B67|nr:hypothetical protein [Endozoicomonas ascidiicola]